jgi:ubiquinone/menaquinone biosynthesis C-methylase UbiE
MAVQEVPPYFDVLFARLANEADTQVAFGRHVHWGYWADPADADGTPANYAHAAEDLCQRVCQAADIHDGMRVLDVGCGFGGTIASLNERFRNLELVGVNIDPRQLERAECEVKPQNGNRIGFVLGEACHLPFSPASFDAVLAVECIFHFPDRGRFFAQASRVLTRGGKLALSDFVPPEEAVPVLRAHGAAADDATRHTYGKINVLCPTTAYGRLAEASGLTLVHEEDISQETLPTYSFLRKHQRAWHDRDEAKVFDKATGQLELAAKTGLLRYTILSFRKQAVSLAKSA